MADRQGCEGRVHFHGKVPPQDLYGFLARADILVVPSRFESFGLTVIEGFAFGKAVVAARAGGMAEIVDDGNTGLLTEPGDFEALAETLDRLIADRELRARLGCAARSEYERRFSGDRMARDLARFLSGFERSFIPTSQIAPVSCAASWHSPLGRRNRDHADSGRRPRNPRPAARST